LTPKVQEGSQPGTSGPENRKSFIYVLTVRHSRLLRARGVPNTRRDVSGKANGTNEMAIAIEPELA
jgi:hypothetical protein